MNECISQAPPHSLCVLPCSAENGEKEEVPKPPPEPPKKTAPPPPPPKKEEGGSGGLEFWGELEVQRVKFLVRTQQGHPEASLPRDTHLHTTSPPILLLSPPVPDSALRGTQAGQRTEMSPDRAEPRHRAACLGGPPLAPWAVQHPFSSPHTLAHLEPLASASHPHPPSLFITWAYQQHPLQRVAVRNRFMPIKLVAPAWVYRVSCQ